MITDLNSYGIATINNRLYFSRFHNTENPNIIKGHFLILDEKSNDMNFYIMEFDKTMMTSFVEDKDVKYILERYFALRSQMDAILRYDIFKG